MQFAAGAVEMERTSVVKGELNTLHNSTRLHDGVLQGNKPRTEFVRQMNHELRTPLNVIIGLCQYLERDRESPLSEEQLDTVVRMERNARALLESVNRLLECVRRGEYE